MNVYNVDGSYQQHCVVANSIGEAERIYNAKYWPSVAKKIELHSEYVQIEKYDEQPRKILNVV